MICCSALVCGTCCFVAFTANVPALGPASELVCSESVFMDGAELCENVIHHKSIHIHGLV